MLARSARGVPGTAWSRTVWTGTVCLGLLAGCTEPPAYTLSWTLVDSLAVRTVELAIEAQVRTELESQGVVDEDEIAAALADALADARDEIDASAVAPMSQASCSAVGISMIRVTTSGATETVSELSCGAGAVDYDGPPLSEGVYDIEIVGLRRNGEPWPCPSPNLKSRCVARELLRDVELGPDATLPLEVVLVTPPECDDGIDNDRDGKVDGTDPACLLDNQSAESADYGVTLFQTSVSFLGSSAVTPDNVGVDFIRTIVDCEPGSCPDPNDPDSEAPQFPIVTDYSESSLDLTRWPFRIPLQGARLDPGEYTFSITAVGAGAQELTDAYVESLSVAEDQPSYIVGNYDFGGDRFVDPIVYPARFNVGMLLAPGDTTGPNCRLGNSAQTPIERVWLRVTDANDAPLDAAALALTPTAVDEGGGWVSLDCPSAPARTGDLTWGSYAVELQARIGADVCFASAEVQDLAPQPTSNAQNFYLERELVGDTPAGACVECTIDGECSPPQVCVSGVCVDKEFGGG